jgi:hypothetical protein
VGRAYGIISAMRTRLAAGAALIVLSALGACTSNGESPVGGPPTLPSATESPTAPSEDTLTLGYGNIGPATIGMSKEEAAATDLFVVDSPPPVEGCEPFHLVFTKELEDKGLDVLAEEDGIHALGIRKPGVETDKGVTVGSTLAEVKAAYADLTEPEEAGYGQSGAFTTDGTHFIGFLFNEQPGAITDDSEVTFIETTKEKPGLMRDGC